MKFYLLVFLVACALTYISVPLVRQFALATGTLAPVRERDVHQFPTPRLGGVAMGLGFLAAMGLAWHLPYLAPAVNTGAGRGLLVGAALSCAREIAPSRTIWGAPELRFTMLEGSPVGLGPAST